MLFAVALSTLSPHPSFAQLRAKVEIVPLVPHAINIRTVAFSPDDARVISGSQDWTIKLWDVASGKLLRTFDAHHSMVTSVAFSPDGGRIVSGSFDESVMLWDAATGALLHTLKGHSGGVTSVAFSPDGTRVISGSYDKTIKLWDAATGTLILTVQGHSDSISSVAFSRAGNQMLSGSADKTAKLWDCATGALIRTFQGHSDAVSSARLSPDGTRVLSGSEDKTLKLWDTATGALIRSFEGHSGPVNAVSFSPRGDRALSGSADKTIRLWDINTGTLVRTYRDPSDAVNSVAFSSDGTQILSGSGSSTSKILLGRIANNVKLWDVTSGHLLRTFEGYSSWIWSIALSRDGRRLAWGTAEKSLMIWDAASGQLQRTLRGHSGVVLSVKFSSDGSRLASGSSDHTIKLWDASTGALLRTLEGHNGPVNSVDFSPDGTRILSGSDDKSVKLWDAATGTLIRTFEGHSAAVSSVAYSPNGTQLLSGSGDQTVRLWNVSTGGLLRAFKDHTGKVGSVAFSPDGTRALSSNRPDEVHAGDNTIRLWNITTGERLLVLSESIPYVAIFSPDGSRLLAGSQSGKISMWNAATGKSVRTWEAHTGTVSSIAFSPDGRHIFSSSNDTTSKVWDSDTGQLLATLLGSRDDEWLAITPDGFFGASPDGAKMLAVVRGLEVFSVRQFYDHLYRPDLVEEFLKDDHEGKYKDEAFKLNLQKILDSGPAPQIEHIKERDARAGDTYRLAVRLTDVGGGIGEKVVWRVGDQVRAVSGARIQSGAATDKAVMVSASIPVDPSQDTIVEVTAYNGAGLLASQPYQIRIDKFGATTEERPRMYALAIGVSKYRMPDYELQLAAKDASAFGEALKKVGGGLFGADKVFVKTLLDEQVTNKGIEAAFHEIAARAKLGDVFVLYLSGHGKSVAGRYYYYPQTLDFAQGQRVEQDGIGQDAWQTWIARVAAQKKVLILDTCESSAAAGLIRGGGSTRRTAMDQLQHATGENLIAAARQAAFEGWQGHGVLTYALLEAMSKKEGNKNEDRIKVAELASYVDERVPEISQRLTGLYQKPTYRLSGSDFPIGVREAVLTQDGSIPIAPTHVLIRRERVREQAAPDTQGERELSPGMQVRVLKFDGAWALIARDGQKLGFVPADAIAQIQ